ncbi:GMC oxidoreductase [Plenodomus tracheiphilus IPT5]|uniref:GMC oxidoreductase n=1 Tax=Plenodomus tracheiphilus IPT5 TaxID=1408161 RepID=A0A6A7B0F0_9PLEO|nr:GMC oxidoreductase [Plenodomus tracheiphilus IPT5]
MRSQSIFASFCVLSAALAVPLSKREQIFQSVNGPKLSGSSFGIARDATYDYVVVGGGNAGLTIAARLAQQYSVAIIEAGSFYEIENGNLTQIPAFDNLYTGKDPKDVNRVDWGFLTTPQKELTNESVHYARGKTLGGCTARNYMTYQLGTRESYKMMADMVADDAYEYDNFLPYFEKSLNFTPPDNQIRAANATPEYDTANLGDGTGPLRATFANYANPASSWVQLGLEQIGLGRQRGFTSGSLNGSSYSIANIDHSTGTRESSETSFLQWAMRNSEIQVYQSTLAEKILFDSQKRATGVSCDSAGLKYTLSARREVIVSAGAFQSPQLLMVSGVGPADALQKFGIKVVSDLRAVGQNMWDHVYAGPSYRVNVPTGSALGNPGALLRAEMEFRNRQAGPLSNPGGDLLAFEKLPEASRRALSNETQRALEYFPSDWPEVEYLATNGYLGYQNNYQRDSPTDGYNYFTVAIANVAPLSRGTITLKSADMADPPVINPNWLSHPADREVMVAGYKRVRDLWNTPTMAGVRIGEEVFPGPSVASDAQILDLIRQSLSPVFHPVGTCAMGRANSTDTVVDSHARVLGTEGLRVVDASILPILPPGHPVATIYAIAEKIAADILAGQ